MKKNKTERINLQFNYNKKNQNSKNRAKSKTPRTTVGTVNTSVYEENKINDNINDLIIKPDTRDSRDMKKNIDNPILIKPNYSKYLTRQNFYPKTLRIEPNKERLTSDELFYETKTSFRDNKILNDLYQRAFKKCNYHSNFYDNLNNDKRPIYYG